MPRNARLLLLALALALGRAHGDLEQPRKLLADRAWFSQLARVRRTEPATGATESCGAAGSDGACLAVIEQLQPGTTLEGYELVERTALLGVCRQPVDGTGGAPAGRLAGHQSERASDEGGGDDAADSALAGGDASEKRTLELALRSPFDGDSSIEDDSNVDEDVADDSSSSSSSDDEDAERDGESVARDAQSVCTLPLASSSPGDSNTSGSGASTDVAQSTPLADGPTLEYQCSRANAHELYVNANYRLQTKFDAGSHGEVWKATRRSDGARFVLKRLFLERGDAMVEMGLREAHFGRMLTREPHVARFVEHFFRPRGVDSAESADTGATESAESDPTGAGGTTNSDSASRDWPVQELWLVFHDEGVSLRQYLYAARAAPGAGVVLEPSAFWRRLRTDAHGEDVFREVVRQVLQGVAALHARGITHRDIKPSNILVAPHARDAAPVVRLADFGSAIDAFTLRHLYACAPSQAEETREYQPPEALLHDGGQPYDYAAPQTYDLWSVGVVVLEMLLGSPHVFGISSRARARLDAALPRSQDAAARRKSYLLHVLAHEFCIYQPPPHQLRALWTAHAVAADGCSFGRFNATVMARDPLRKGPANPWALDLIWKLLQWHPAQRISAARALEHAFFTGAYVCAASGRSFATRDELALHESYLAAQRARDNELACAVRERVEPPHVFACPHCGRRFATVASCEQHARARSHDAHTRFCAFDAQQVTDAVATETRAYCAAQPHLVSTAGVGASVGLALFQGRKKYMEDFVVIGADAQLGLELFAVADGHLGTRAAAFVAAQLLSTVTRNLAAALAAGTNGSSSSEREREFAERLALRQTFLELQSGVLAHDDGFSGCTLTVVLLFRTEQRVVSANVGDSRTVLLAPMGGDGDGAEPTPLSMDHWPNEPNERARVEASGGFVSFHGLWRVVGQLAVSRSLGDRHLRQYVSAEPSIFRAHVAPGAALVLASDGLWETMSSTDVAHFVRERRVAHTPVGETAQRLLVESYVRGSQDNIALVVIEL